MAASEQLRVIIFKEGALWVAQVLEHDIGAQAEDLDELQRRLDLTLQLEREESARRQVAPFAGIDPAPRHFQEMWENRAGQFQPSPTRAVTATTSAPKLEMALCA